ncbi:MAG: hypothetical protein ACK4OM_05225 [Alphaproteobacteria bacterium]
MTTKEDLILERLERLEELLTAQNQKHPHSNEKYFTDLSTKTGQALVVDKSTGDFINFALLTALEYFHLPTYGTKWNPVVALASKVSLVWFVNSKGGAWWSEYLATPFYEDIYIPLTEKLHDTYENWGHKDYDHAIEHVGEIPCTESLIY